MCPLHLLQLDALPYLLLSRVLGGQTVTNRLHLLTLEGDLLTQGLLLLGELLGIEVALEPQGLP